MRAPDKKPSKPRSEIKEPIRSVLVRASKLRQVTSLIVAAGGESSGRKRGGKE